MPVPIGGGIKLVEALMAIITDNGGQLITGADVKKILVENGKAMGVKLSDGQELFAKKAVLSSTTPKAL